MADGQGHNTRFSQLAKSVASLHATQETQNQHQSITTSMMIATHVVANMETLIHVQQKSREDSTTSSTSHGNPLFGEHGGIQTRTIRLEFPKFNGEDPNGWIYGAQQFFTYHQTNPHHRVLMASFHMEGKALNWFQDLESSGRITGWEGFTATLRTRFGPTLFNDPMEALTRLRQTATVEAYKTEFEEENVAAFRRNNHPSFVPTWPIVTLPSNQEKQMIVPVQRLSQVQMKERRERGLCYNCDEKWGPGHKCKYARLFIMECTESGEDELQSSNESFSVGGAPDTEKAEQSQSMHYQGLLVPELCAFWDRLVVVQCTHGFMNSSIQQRARLQSKSTEGLQVKVANGDILLSEGKCSNIPFIMQGHTYHTDFYIITLGGCDVVLSVQWLSTLGPILWEFDKLRMEFSMFGRVNVLQGIKPTDESLMEGEEFGRALKQNKKGLVLQLLETNDNSSSGLDTNSSRFWNGWVMWLIAWLFLSCLTKKLGNQNVLHTTLSPCDDNGAFKAAPDEILQRRMCKKGHRAANELLVKWQGLGVEEASWVEYGQLSKEFSDLVGKVF
uniref:Chromo domain-containing protein n=1 Tax=Salix viminalis TaxID=40686 RepID=A0A6N2JVX6_SALVM